MSELQWEDRHRRRTPRPPTEQEQAEYDAWHEKYQASIEEGLERLWLDYIPYEGYSVNGPKPSGYEEHEETDEEYESRVHGSMSYMSKIVWETNQKMLSQFVENRRLLDTLFVDPPSDEEGSVTFTVKKRGENDDV